MGRIIPLSTPNLSLDIVENLKECIETGWVSTGGRFIGEFENKIAEYVGTDEAVSVQSGTAGLHIALKVLGVEPGDEVIVPTLTFIAAVNPVSYVGAYPVFMDCDDSLCIDPVKLEKFLEEECRQADEKTDGKFRRVLVNKHTGRRVSAVVVVHVFGNLADMGKIAEIAERYDLKVLEDATEALGSYYTEGSCKGKFAGTIGDIGVYSFNANKIITTGGGGMIVAKDNSHLAKARYLGVQAKDDSLYFMHNEIGYNYRMLNIQAALGVDQIDRLEEFIEIKIRNYNTYKEYIAKYRGKGVRGLKLLPFREGTRSNHWFYSLLIEPEYPLNRDALLAELNKNGIQSRPVWALIHKQKPYAGCQSYEIEKAPHYEKSVLNVPCSTHLTEEDIKYILDILINF